MPTKFARVCVMLTLAVFCHSGLALPTRRVYRASDTVPIPTTSRIDPATDEVTSLWVQRRADIATSDFRIIRDKELNPFVATHSRMASMRRHRTSSDGWDAFTVATAYGDGKASAEDKYFAAGYLEGFATAANISAAFVTSRVAEQLHDKCVAKAVNNQYDFTVSLAVKRGSVKRVLAQMRGLAAGYEAARVSVRGRVILQRDWFAWNMLEEIEQIRHIVCGNTTGPGLERSIALIKVVRGDVIIGHSKWAPYNTMSNRQLKRYAFDDVHGDVTMSSYAGRISSTDDFIVVGKAFVVLRTTLGDYRTRDAAEREALMDEVAMSLPQFIRVRTSLSETGHGKKKLDSLAFAWIQKMSQHVSPAAASEFLVLDLRQSATSILDLAPLPVRSIFVLDQVVGKSYHHDISFIANRDKFVTSVGLPSSSAAAAVCGIISARKKTATLLDRVRSPRMALLSHFAERDRNRGTVHDVLRLLRHNNYTRDGASLEPWCMSGTNPYNWTTDLKLCTSSQRLRNPALAVAPRFDLVNHTVPAALESLAGQAPFGAIDAKVTSAVLILREVTILAQAGPTWSDGVPAFENRWNPVEYHSQPAPYRLGLSVTHRRPPFWIATFSVAFGTAMLAGIAFTSMRRRAVGIRTSSIVESLISENGTPQKQGYTPLA